MGEYLAATSAQAFAGRTIYCLLFDLGDTLWSRKDLRVWQKMEHASNMRAVALMKANVPCSLLPDADDATLGTRLRAIIDEQMRLAIRRNPEIEPDAGYIVVEALRRWDMHNLDLATGAAIFEALRVRIPGSRPLFDDVLSTLEVLQQRGFRLGVVTNRHWGGQLFQEDLQEMGLLRYFDPAHMAISADLGIRKPNPAIFKHALQSLACVPEQAVLIGDSLRSDVVGAKLLGMGMVWKPKPAMLQQMYVHTNAMNAPASGQHTPPVAYQPADLPAGLHVTDDDYVLAQAQTNKWDEYAQGTIQSDLVIETLSELLDILVTVGPQ